MLRVGNTRLGEHRIRWEDRIRGTHEQVRRCRIGTATLVARAIAMGSHARDWNRLERKEKNDSFS
jgi:hypothetical protein